MCVKLFSFKASYPRIRRTRVPNLERWIIYTESTKNSYRILKNTKTTQAKNKTVFIPDKTHKQNLPSYKHTVCAPIWNISHIVSTVPHCGLQRNDQYRTHNQRFVSLVPSNRQRKEQLGQCPNLMECQTESDPGNAFSSVFLKDQEEHSTQIVWFWI